MLTQLLHAPSPSDTGLEPTLEALEHVRRDMIERERCFAPVVADLPAAARSSARNLIHYLALRAHDLGAVQRVLAAHGLSSRGRAEPHVLANLDTVLSALRGRAAAARGGGARAPGRQGSRSF